MPLYKFTFKTKFRLPCACVHVHTHTHTTSDNIPLKTLENTSLCYILKNGIGGAKGKHVESLYQFAFAPALYESATYFRFSIVVWY